jgi:large subunit ribosomal protein L24
VQGTSAVPGAVAPWPAEPFEQAFGRLSGHVAVKSPRVTLTPKLVARDVRSVLHFGESQLALQVSDGSLAGGRIAGELIFLREGEALIARTGLRLAGANAGDLLPGDGLLSGRLTVDVTAEGTGMSPIALVGSLGGSGSFTLENAKLARLDPGAFDAVIRAVDQGLPIDVTKVRDRMDSALAGGGLSVALAEGAITINAGQARLSNTMVRAQGADLAVAGGVNLSEGVLDARLTFSGVAGASAPGDSRPEILVALKGPANAPKRTIDVAALASWLALRAVDQQSKKLDLLEGRESPPPPASPPPAAPTADVPTGSAPIQNAPAAAPAAVLTEPEPPRTRPVLPTPPKPRPTVPTAEQVPPPIDIRPAPAAPRAPRQPGTVGTQGAARAAPAPAAPRSLSEILFGR